MVIAPCRFSLRLHPFPFNSQLESRKEYSSFRRRRLFLLGSRVPLSVSLSYSLSLRKKRGQRGRLDSYSTRNAREGAFIRSGGGCLGRRDTIDGNRKRVAPRFPPRQR